MQRAMPEVLASQRQMLIRRGADPDKSSDEVMAQLFENTCAGRTTGSNSSPMSIGWM